MLQASLYLPLEYLLLLPNPSFLNNAGIRPEITLTVVVPTLSTDGAKQSVREAAKTTGIPPNIMKTHPCNIQIFLSCEI